MMSTKIFRFAPLVLITLLAACTPSLKVMTFNVRYASDTGPHRWEARRPVMIALIRSDRPDVIGTQELYQRQGDDLVRALPEYSWFGRDRRGGHADEHMGVLYRTDRLRLLKQGDFWLSDTPEQPNSMSWGADLPRMVTWGIFETRGADKRRFAFLNTHFAHRDRDMAARDRATALILARLSRVSCNLPVVIAGDLNADPTSRTYRMFAGQLTDAWKASDRRRGPGQTFHNFTGVGEKRIDYLFVRDFIPRNVRTNARSEGSVYPSDHFPVSATLKLKRPAIAMPSRSGNCVTGF